MCCSNMFPIFKLEIKFLFAHIIHINWTELLTTICMIPQIPPVAIWTVTYFTLVQMFVSVAKNNVHLIFSCWGIPLCKSGIHVDTHPGQSGNVCHIYWVFCTAYCKFYTWSLKDTFSSAGNLNPRLPRKFDQQIHISSPRRDMLFRVDTEPTTLSF